MKINLVSKMLFAATMWYCASSLAEPNDTDWQQMFSIVTPLVEYAAPASFLNAGR